MKILIKKIIQLINDLSLHSRILILIGVIVLGFFVWHKMIWAPLWRGYVNTNQKIVQIKLESQKLKARLKKLKDGPQVSKRLVVCSSTISPEKMVELLQGILEAQRDLTLIEIKNLPMTVQTSDVTQKQLYEHKIYLKFSGEYFTILAYLQNLENLKWCLTWDKLDYKVLTYPIAEVTLMVHTTSDKEGFLYV